MNQLRSRNVLPAILLSLLMPGLGQVYNGRLLKGACLLIFFCMLPLLLAVLSVRLPPSFLLAGIGSAAAAALGIYLYAAIDSYLLSLGNKSNFALKPYNTFFFYSAAWLAGLALMFAADTYLKDHVVEAYKIIGTSMEPTVLKGDYVLTDKTAYRKEPIRRGDIVIVVYPDDRSKVLIRQVAALPGDRSPGKGSLNASVPHGTVMIKGSFKDQPAVDSSLFGPVDMRDIVGRVTQIYFSIGDEGIRWNRIGTLVNPEKDG